MLYEARDEGMGGGIPKATLARYMSLARGTLGTRVSAKVVAVTVGVREDSEEEEGGEEEGGGGGGGSSYTFHLTISPSDLSLPEGQLSFTRPSPTPFTATAPPIPPPPTPPHDPVPSALALPPLSRAEAQYCYTPGTLAWGVVQGCAVRRKGDPLEGGEGGGGARARPPPLPAWGHNWG